MNDRLSPIEALMWKVGHDARLRMTVGALIVLDRAPTTTALVERIEAAADDVPALRQRPEDGPGLRARPRWVDDDDTSVEHHVRSLSVAAPGSLRQVLDLVGLLESV